MQKNGEIQNACFFLLFCEKNVAFFIHVRELGWNLKCFEQLSSEQLNKLGNLQRQGADSARLNNWWVGRWLRNPGNPRAWLTGRFLALAKGA
jgi:hypothetical protein